MANVPEYDKEGHSTLNLICLVSRVRMTALSTYAQQPGWLPNLNRAVDSLAGSVTHVRE